MLSVKMSHFMS